VAEEILLGVETSRKIENILNGFLRASGARCVFLVSRSGQLISELGFTRDLKVLSIVALLSGIFSATEKIARLIKEELSELLLEGKEWNVYFLSSVHSPHSIPSSQNNFPLVVPLI